MNPGAALLLAVSMMSSPSSACGMDNWSSAAPQLRAVDRRCARASATSVRLAPSALASARSNVSAGTFSLAGSHGTRIRMRTSRGGPNPGESCAWLYEVGLESGKRPIEKITSLVGQVTPAVFSVVQTDHGALRRYLLRITEGLALITFPATLDWPSSRRFRAPDARREMAAPLFPFGCSALSAGFRAVTPLLAQVLNVIGQSRLAMRYGLLCLLVLPSAFYVLGKSGGRWESRSSGSSCSQFSYPGISACLGKIELSGREY